MLDPKTLTPEQLYRLQSETWAQGADYENKRIEALLRARVTKHHPVLEMHIDDLIKLIENVG
jgi:hypothetical protein